MKLCEFHTTPLESQISGILAEFTYFSRNGCPSAPGGAKAYYSKLLEASLEPPSPQNTENPKKCTIPRFSRFPGIPAHFTGIQVFCENVALAAGRPSKTNNKRQVILGFERRERRGRRFRVESEKTRNLHEITEVS